MGQPLSLFSLMRAQIQLWERPSQPRGFHCMLLLLTPQLNLGIHAGILLLFSDGVYTPLACSLAETELTVVIGEQDSPQ